MPEVTMAVVLIVEDCIHCGMQFAVSKNWQDKKRNDHSTFYCPNGHSMAYNVEGPVAKAERLAKKAELDAQARINDARHAQLVAEKERDSAIRAKRKMERRISKGVCPCCNRTFEDLHRHMSTKHKDYALPPGKNAKQIEGPVQ